MLKTHTLSTPQNFQVKHSIAFISCYCREESRRTQAKVWIGTSRVTKYWIKGGSFDVKKYHILLVRSSHIYGLISTTIWCCKSLLTLFYFVRKLFHAYHAFHTSHTTWKHLKHMWCQHFDSLRKGLVILFLHVRQALFTRHTNSLAPT